MDNQPDQVINSTVRRGTAPDTPNRCRANGFRSTPGQRAAPLQMELNLACRSPLAVNTSRCRAWVKATKCCRAQSKSPMRASGSPE